MDSISVVQDVLEKSYVAIGKPASVLVGLSGGADSVALLLSLCFMKEQHGLSLYAVHVNHGLRVNAGGDEEFCKNLCAELSVPLTVKSVKVSSAGSLEAAAREARYAALREEMKFRQADVLALAHHLDDQAETVVMHLMYGSGMAGLGGMRSFQNGVWRPLLQLRRNDLHAYLKQKGFTWREDESNADLSFTRNRIRAKVIPEMEACAQESVRAIGRMTEVLQAEDDYLNESAAGWLDQYAARGDYPFLMANALLKQHKALQRRILRCYAERLSVQLDFEQTERLRLLLQSGNGAVMNLPGEWHALKTQERLHFLHDQKVQDTKSLGTLSFSEKDAAFQTAYVQSIPACQMHDLQLRTRRTGDYIQPFGMQGTKPLKEFMIDRAIDRPFRDAWPLVCRGNEVLWVIGIGASEKLRVQKPDKDSLQMIYSGRLPDQI